MGQTFQGETMPTQFINLAGQTSNHETPCPAFGNHGSVIWTPIGLDSHIPPALLPAALTPPILACLD